MYIDDSTRLHHVLDAAKKAVDFARNKTRSDLENDEILTFALIRCVEIIGEAASRITKERQAELSYLPWSQIISMRNRLIHGYFEVDLDIVWDTVTENLPILITELEEILAEEESE